MFDLPVSDPGRITAMSFAKGAGSFEDCSVDGALAEDIVDSPKEKSSPAQAEGQACVTRQGPTTYWNSWFAQPAVERTMTLSLRFKQRESQVAERSTCLGKICCSA